MTRPLPLFDTRRRRPSLPPVPELSTHIAVADVLRQFVAEGWQWAHYPAGEIRDPRTAAKLKVMGTKPGFPDLFLIDPSGRFHALELKRQGGRLNESQEEFRRWAITHGIPHSVCFSVQEAMTVLVAWGALRIQIGGAR